MIPFLPFPSLDISSSADDDDSNNGRQSSSSSTRVNANIVGGTSTNVSTPNNQCPHKRVVTTPAPLPPPSPSVVMEHSNSTTNHVVLMSVDRSLPLAFMAVYVRQLYYHQEQQEQNHQQHI